MQNSHKTMYIFLMYFEIIYTSLSLSPSLSQKITPLVNIYSGNSNDGC